MDEKGVHFPLNAQKSTVQDVGTASPIQTVTGKDKSKPLMAVTLPKSEDKGCSSSKHKLAKSDLDDSIASHLAHFQDAQDSYDDSGMSFDSIALHNLDTYNYMNIQDEVNQVVIHELIHAYDDCRAANLDWANCAHHACSEIRAGHLSGDCHYKRELLRGYLKIRGHEQECVRRRVMKSMAGNPYCSESASKDAMEAVWDVCYNDTKPFDRAP
ncbi:putative MLP-like protein 34-like [Capsicum annuum]|nr:putative MLP-like protein 34-like [Capsicum annuum]